MNKRFASWKAKTLSPAKRLVLIKAVISAIPTYAMQTARLPKTACDDIDKANRNFFWGHKDNRKPPHLVNWETTSKPKKLEGLGIKSTSQANQAMLAKTRWRLHQNDRGLWAAMLNQKYFTKADLYSAPGHVQPNDSST